MFGESKPKPPKPKENPPTCVGAPCYTCAGPSCGYSYAAAPSQAAAPPAHAAAAPTYIAPSYGSYVASVPASSSSIQSGYSISAPPTTIGVVSAPITTGYQSYVALAQPSVTSVSSQLNVAPSNSRPAASAPPPNIPPLVSPIAAGQTYIAVPVSSLSETPVAPATSLSSAGDIASLTHMNPLDVSQVNSLPASHIAPDAYIASYSDSAISSLPEYTVTTYEEIPKHPKNKKHKKQKKSEMSADIVRATSDLDRSENVEASRKRTKKTETKRLGTETIKQTSATDVTSVEKSQKEDNVKENATNDEGSDEAATTKAVVSEITPKEAVAKEVFSEEVHHKEATLKERVSDDVPLKGSSVKEKLDLKQKNGVTEEAPSKYEDPSNDVEEEEILEIIKKKKDCKFARN
ncbi:hypothetical protein AB6A40_008338 [Gnathostoma spinigerum]|uniref:Uncharacterized protein n=1 Tax=Gnathostoma spinigerum TaxID=75299 RepID=A0ABD6ENT1_9BILA